MTAIQQQAQALLLALDHTEVELLVQQADALADALDLAATPVPSSYPSDLWSDLLHKHRPSESERPYIASKSEYEWSHNEACAWDAWVEACDEAETRAEAEWKQAQRAWLTELVERRVAA